MVQTAGHNIITLSNSFQDLLRRGLPLQQAAAALVQALEGPNALLQALRPVPDIISALHQAAGRAGHAAAPAAGAGGGLPGAHPPRAAAHAQGAQDATGWVARERETRE